MNPYIVDMPTRFSFFGKSKKKDNYNEKDMHSSQAALEDAARKAMAVVEKGMAKANEELEKDEKELDKVTAKHALSTKRHYASLGRVCTLRKVPTIRGCFRGPITNDMKK
jgi:hypothetical protein